jgi:hypothetical protein
LHVDLSVSTRNGKEDLDRPDGVGIAGAIVVGGGNCLVGGGVPLKIIDPLVLCSHETMGKVRELTYRVSHQGDCRRQKR